MDALKLRRTPLRTAFTKAVNHLQEIIENDPVDMNAVETAFEQLKVKSAKLKDVEDAVLELMIESNCTQEAYNIEFEAIEGYAEKMIAWQVRVKNIMKTDALGQKDNHSLVTSSPSSLRLPKIQFQQFSGESDVKCIICNKRHYAVLCSKLPLRSGLETESASVENSTTASSSSSNVLANQACTSVLLQTLVVVLQNGNHKSLAKARVAPLKDISIPRLELLSCTLGTRLAASVKNDLNLPDVRIYYLTDSMTALAWIQRTRDCGVFSFNRVKEIRNLSGVSSWEHVPSEKNFADILSRGCSAQQLIYLRWWEGEPSWLSENPVQCPRSKQVPDENAINLELRKSVLVNTVKRIEEFNWHCKYFSSYLKVVRMIAWIFRFFKNAKRIDVCNTSEITFSEFDHAEKIVIKLIQMENFEGVTDEKLRPLKPFLDQFGILRARTKLSFREDTDNFKFPIILPNEHPVVHLMIVRKHEELMHASVSIIAKEELGETDEIRVQALEKFRKCILSDKKLKCPTNDEFLIQFLRARKYDVDKAMGLLHNYFNLIASHPEIFDKLDKEKMDKLTSSDFINILPFRDNDGCLVLIVKIKNWDPEDVSVQVLFCTVAVIIFCLEIHPADQICGIRLIYDCENYSLKQMRCFVPRYLPLVSKALRNSLPVRFKSIHVVNEPISVRFAWTFLRVFLSEKIKNR
ncbi:alpha-tocopherol transfer protein-like, partial [Trichonephila inaurata madagascariensis]